MDYILDIVRNVNRHEKEDDVKCGDYIKQEKNIKYKDDEDERNNQIKNDKSLFNDDIMSRNNDQSMSIDNDKLMCRNNNKIILPWIDLTCSSITNIHLSLIIFLTFFFLLFHLEWVHSLRLLFNKNKELIRC